MLSFLLTAYLYLVVFIVLFVIVLSVFGSSTGIREKAADVLLIIFEWASTQTVEDNLLEEPLSEEELEADEYPAGLGVDDDAVSNSSQSTANGSRVRKRRVSGDQPLIARQWSDSIESKLSSQTRLDELPQRDSTVKVIVNDTLEFVTAGVESIIEDRVTNRFTAAQLASWNLLSRNKSAYSNINLKLRVIWLLGFLFRYIVLFPVRLYLFLIAVILMLSLTTVIGHMPKRWRKPMNRIVMLMCFRIYSRSFSSIIRYHDKENKAEGGGICVANHTSPIDVMVLSCDNVYAMIGQRQGGVLGLLQRTLSRAEHHIWFERSEANDRKKVLQALQDHVNDPSKLPILIFPEGTCINNTSVMLFKKGSFDVASTIYPIALKYDNRLGDAFWNSHATGYMGYLLSMMTSWALICDVWYLPPVSREQDESAIDFARRVKRMIAKKGGLIDLEWDGNLKRSTVPEKLKNEQKDMFYNYLARTTSICGCTAPNPEKLAKLMEKGLPEAFDEEENEDPEKRHHHDDAEESDSSLFDSSQGSLDDRLAESMPRQRRRVSSDKRLLAAMNVQNREQQHTTTA